MRIVAIILALAMPTISFAAIQFDFMEEPWALSKHAREQLINKLKEVDFKKIEDSLREAGASLPDEVKELPGKAIDKFEEEGIDVEGTASGIWDTFSSLGNWMFGAVVSVFEGEE